MSLARRLGGLFVAALVAGCGAEYPQSSVDPRSDFAHVIHGLYTSVFWWTMVILAVVWFLLGYVLFRFRERPGTPQPRQTHGHLGMEIAWTVGPAFVVVAIAVPTIQAVFATQRGDPENAMVVEVVGHQFWWEYRYPDFGVVTANELYLPVGRPVSLRLHSADVIHSFWVPQLGGKRDLNPLVARPEGQAPDYNWLHFTVLEPGVYTGQCAEFCGLSHSLMGTRVVAVGEDDFRAWIADMGVGNEPPPAAPQAAPGDSTQADTTSTAAAGGGAPQEGGLQQPGQVVAPPADPVEVGRQVFHSSTCIACHAIQGTNAQGVLGPSLTLLGRRATIGAGWLENTPENLARWITDPASVKPGVLMPGVAAAGGNWPATNLSEEQVTAVAAYLSSLR